MKKRICSALFILIGSIITIVAFFIGLTIIEFLLNNPIILIILLVLTIVITIRDYIKNI
jgi:hypothetical protein